MQRNILIIEDKEQHIKSLHKILDEVQGINVFEAHNIAEAYCVLSSNCIHLFLVDIVLDTDAKGDVSGLTFVENIRKDSRYEFTPVIFVTSLEDPKLLSYTQLQCFGYVEKPFESSQVKNLISKALKFPIAVEEDKNLFFRKDGIIYSVKEKDIVYIETSFRKTEIVTKDDKLVIPYKTLSEIMHDLDNRFIQCSRYAIINRDFIEYVDNANRYIKLRHVDHTLEIGKSYTKRIKEVLGND